MALDTVDDAPETTVTSDENADRARLDDLIAQATSKYAVKDYGPAAELYSKATELQALLNGEMNVENADLLYSYGKCLYFVAVSNSDVLGAKAAGEKVGNVKEGPSETRKAAPSKSTAGTTQSQKVAEEVVATIATEKDPSTSVLEPEKTDEKEEKPLFQFTGDENWDDSDGEEAAEQEGQDEEEEDDFSNAFEILDVARVLLKRKLEQLEEASTSADKGKEKASDSGDTTEARQVKERLADTHDLQAEISLEGERFPNAVDDLRAALTLKQQLCPKESSQIAECHYKLSLALEFSSVTQEKDENGEALEGKAAIVDEAMRNEAATEMERAIESCQLRIQKEQAELDGRKDSSEDVKGKQISQKDIDEVKEMVADMRQRLVDLRAPPVSINDPNSTGTLDGATPLNGILGQILGESAEQQKKRLEEASVNAKDVSGLIKRKKDSRAQTNTPEPASNASSGPVINGNGKRKLDSTSTSQTAVEDKRARVEDVDDTK